MDLEDVLNEFSAELEDLGPSYALLKTLDRSLSGLCAAAVGACRGRDAPAPLACRTEQASDERLLQAGLDAARGVLERVRWSDPPRLPAQALLQG